jgi:hypothetical protein
MGVEPFAVSEPAVSRAARDSSRWLTGVDDFGDVLPPVRRPDSAGATQLVACGGVCAADDMTARPESISAAAIFFMSGW